ncbi:hypothetical protein Hanom_Chr06g00550111 [Helianthus anomalus]
MPKLKTLIYTFLSWFYIKIDGNKIRSSIHPKEIIKQIVSHLHKYWNDHPYIKSFIHQKSKQPIKTTNVNGVIGVVGFNSSSARTLIFKYYFSIS